ncbi:hypothetical protein A2926_00350 [Candidatus Giovannonibacteria bacterium RIFCSPLOWO2_01_FULL_44_40]|uniref:Uncharacterized protein n=1 Tax=Candidatus Giovannonibacteria bacterium RIFCSPHIGHO2_01_FULL_45_23 TaxID=1798325 RepID=A0A1F5VEQ3_9BACT|nr:MAG: hypothetical protein A2834_00365 [Candidatus Giovannonibacteria bacterium RIFCSPHIGHO2_01_FULL_45_23]OGF76502.1 MAG: hypothetical protein A3C77_03070 [Candidatus Giovannonibacteria bacterium RIFCSPHIGHO2_02_FULL_45_13]OGF79768.1 MAG: hypothetical protein A2926_00350 [Candidatus Giovannonibacteria bacterium RIFCSPLOWO2_01_FULL_44_40]
MADGDKELPKIRTLKTDAEEYISEKKISQLDIARGAYLAGREAGETFRPKNQFPYRAVAYGVVAVLIIGLAGYFSYKLFFKTSPEIATEAPKPFASFLSAEDEKTISFSEANPGALSGALGAERQKSLRAGTIIYFPIKILKPGGEEKFADAKELAGFLNWQAPKDFLNNLEPDFNALIIYGPDSRDFAAILKVKNFASALAQLFSWESAMWFDWKPFLAEEDVKNISKFSFQDEIIQNNDARVFRNSGGKIILGYSIFNKKYVIISTSRDALSIILERFIKLPPR